MDKGAKRVIAARDAPGALILRYPVELTDLLLKARVGQGLHGKKGLEICLIRHIVKNMDRWELAIHQAKR